MRTPVSDPQRIGPYAVVGRLGSGGMGWVYLARSPAGEAVAVKVVRAELAADDGFRRRFAREVAAARAVAGEYTAAVVDADPLASPPWLATEYVAAPSLAEAVAASGPLPEPELRRLGAGLVEALRAIHAAGVVHRDLKPSNVLLAADRPRVIDFGVSLLDGTGRLTRAGSVLGTPAYMAPEQLTGAGVGPPCDIFALGGVLAYAATGRAPFGDGSGVMYRVAHEAPDLSAVPPGVRETVARCLDKDPRRRPGTAALLGALAPPGTLPSWPAPVTDRIRERGEDLARRRSAGAAGVSMAPALLLHARTLLDAGLTGTLVRQAVDRGRSR
ncbi:Serine/threonine-protein kinase PknD [Streptomyces sp. RB5]|uniref:Serine/threonine-protein kinase PknD n=1 Tax=Streptomyces smaragdinus TaxID=2585196 RepID=A0A7K0CB45_9ACTN|nr:serine/threonine-protein kinase [Streptomyces smaragdinus]MQY10362.1 Serine/threonine-protein kinase PknD [Streptomyces smaragdinus]